MVKGKEARENKALGGLGGEILSLFSFLILVRDREQRKKK